jgi:hypothetical protein
MSKLVPCVGLLGLLLIAAGSAPGDERAATPKSAVEALLARLDAISHDAEMTSAKRAMASAAEVEKFNQQYKGKQLSVRLAIQDVVPYAKGSYVSAGSPDLAMVQFRTAMFQIHLPIAEAAAIGRDSVLVVTGTLSGTTQPRRGALASVLEPGTSISFPSRANSNYRICLDNASWQVEHAKAAAEKSSESKTAAADTPAEEEGLDMPTPHGKHSRKERTDSPETRTVDDLKAFFLKGIAPSQFSQGAKTANTPGRLGTGTGTGTGIGTGIGTGAGSKTGAGSAKVKHNHIYTADDLLRRFGEPVSRTTNKDMTESWTFKCKDGTVHVRFNVAGYAGGASESGSKKLRLKVTSVDAQSGTVPGPPRYGR